MLNIKQHIYKVYSTVYCVCVCVSMCLIVEKTEMLSVLLYHSLIDSLKTESVSLFFVQTQSVARSNMLLFLLPPNWSYRQPQPCPDFYMGVEDPNSDSHGYAESSLTHRTISVAYNMTLAKQNNEPKLQYCYLSDNRQISS